MRTHSQSGPKDDRTPNASRGRGPDETRDSVWSAVASAPLFVRRPSTAGFSLIEVMVAILILAIALAGLTHGITTALASNKEAELQTTAALLAQGKIEELRAYGLLTDGEEEGDCGEALALYRWRQTIAATDIAGLHEVTVAVENARTGQRIYDLKTMLFEPPSDSASGSGNRKSAKSKRRSEEGL